MGDLKLYGKLGIEVHSLTNTIRNFSTDVAVEFGLEEYATLARNWGKITHSNGIEMLNW